MSDQPKSISHGDHPFPTIRLMVAVKFAVLGVLLTLVTDHWVVNMCFSVGGAFLGSAAYTIWKNRSAKHEGKRR